MKERTKPCSCLEYLDTCVKRIHPDGYLELKQQIDMKTFESSMALPPLFYCYTEGKKKKRGFFVFTYCPFCGEKI